MRIAVTNKLENLSEEDQKEAKKIIAEFEKKEKNIQILINKALERVSDLEDKLYAFREEKCKILANLEKQAMELQEEKEDQKTIQRQSKIVIGVIDNLFTHLKQKAPELENFFENYKKDLIKNVPTN